MEAVSPGRRVAHPRATSTRSPTKRTVSVLVRCSAIRLAMPARSPWCMIERDGGEARPAQARHDVGSPEGHPQGAGDGQQCGVAGLVAAPLVQLGHPADVDDEDLNLCGALVGQPEQLRGAENEPTPVAQPGELVDHQQLLELRVDLAQLAFGVGLLGHVAEDGAGQRRAVPRLERLDRHLRLDGAAVTPPHPAEATRLPRAQEGFDAHQPPGVVVVEEALAAPTADLFLAQAEDGAGGRVGRQNAPFVGLGEEHPIGAVLEEHPQCCQAVPSELLRLAVDHAPSLRHESVLGERC